MNQPNGVNTLYSYDTANRLTGVNGIQYILDANGNRIQMTDWEGVTTYTYDALDRLMQATYPTSTVTYTLDSVGNRLDDGMNSFAYDPSDRITNSGYTYDANGNLLADGFATYEYDAANRLIQMTRSGVVTTYGYDGWGNLIQETANGVTTEFVLDENAAYTRILGEVRSDGGERLYAYGAEGFTAQQTVGGGIEYPLLDGLGSVRYLTDASGTVILSRSYDAYGSIRYATGTGSSRLGYTGEMQDPVSGLVYLRARHYHPTIGRFLQRDSFGGSGQRPQSLNRYSYTENNPVNLVDPSGHYSVEELQRHFGVHSFEELQELFADGGKYAGFSGWYDILRAAQNGDNVTSIHPFGPTSIHGTFMQLCDGEIVVNLGGRQLVPEFEIARFGGYWKGAADKGWGSDYGMYHLQGATVEIWATAISGRQMVNDMPCNTWDCVAIGIDLASVGYAYTSEAAFWSTPVTTVGGAAGFTYGKFAQVGTATAGVVWVEYQFQRGKASSTDVWVTRATASAGFVPFPVVSPVAATSQLLWDLLDPIHPW